MQAALLTPVALFLPPVAAEITVGAVNLFVAVANAMELRYRDRRSRGVYGRVLDPRRANPGTPDP